jgi:hypothetical protein
MTDYSPGRKAILHNMVLFDREKRKDFSKYGPVLKAAHQYYWPKWTGDLTYDGKSLKITGTNLGRMYVLYRATAWSTLRQLPVESVDLSHSDFFFLSDFIPLEGMKRLDVSHTEAKLHPGFGQDNFKALKEIVISKHRAAKNVPKRIRVIVR